MKSKLVRVLDEGTDMVFIVGKFENPDNREWKLLDKAGWGTEDGLTLIAKFGPIIQASLSRFCCPPYDLKKRGNLDVNHTTIALATYLRDKKFEEIPDVIDVGKEHH